VKKETGTVDFPRYQGGNREGKCRGDRNGNIGTGERKDLDSGGDAVWGVSKDWNKPLRPTQRAQRMVGRRKGKRCIDEGGHIDSPKIDRCGEQGVKRVGRTEQKE